VIILNYVPSPKLIRLDEKGGAISPGLIINIAGGSVRFSRRAKVPKENKDFFLKECFWHFPPEYNTSNANPQIGLENRGYFQRQFSPV